MIYRKESAESFNRTLQTKIHLQDGDILPPKYLKTIGIESEDVCVIVDNSIPNNQYIIIDNKGKEQTYSNY